MPKFKAPNDVTAITISDGTVYHAGDKQEDGTVALSGFATIPAEAPSFHFDQMAANGWTLLPDDTTAADKADDKAAKPPVTTTSADTAADPAKK